MLIPTTMTMACRLKMTLPLLARRPLVTRDALRLFEGVVLADLSGIDAAATPARATSSRARAAEAPVKQDKKKKTTAIGGQPSGGEITPASSRDKHTAIPEIGDYGIRDTSTYTDAAAVCASLRGTEIYCDVSPS